MTNPLQTQPGRPTYTPNSDKPPRKSNRATVVAQKAAETRKANPYVAGIVGIAILGADLVLMLKHPPAGVGDQVAHGAWAFVGITFLGLLEMLVDGLKKFLAVAGPYIPWGKKDGGAS